MSETSVDVVWLTQEAYDKLEADPYTKARIILMKDLGRAPLHYYTIRRLEHLRRTVRYNLTRLQKNGRLEG